VGDSQLQQLAAWVAELEWGSLPSSVRERASSVLLDDLGAILAGAAQPDLAAIRALYAPADEGDATVLAEGFPRLHRHAAAELNGIAAAWMEVDEGYRLAVAHAGLYSIPAALAAAEACDADLSRLFLAVVAGYEVAARLAAHYRFPTRTVHPHGALSPAGASAAVSVIRGHDAGTTAAAITAACSMAIASPFDHAIRGGVSRNLWAGAGGRMGMLAAETAAVGVAGLPDADQTVFGVLLGATRAERDLNHGLGDRFAIEDGYHKVFACCQYLHSTIDATLQVRGARRDVRWPHDVVRVDVVTHDSAVALSNRAPTNMIGAQFSLAHAVAAAVVHGTGDARGFEPATLDHPDFVRIRSVVNASVGSGFGDRRPSHVTVTFADGTSADARCEAAPGDPSRPISRDELVEKFVRLASATVSVTTAQQVASLIVKPPEGLSVRALIATLREGQGSR
jgi:2-methylcitrate dehydratase PrpD